MEPPHERALREIEEVFGDRLKRGPAPGGAGDALGSVSPMSAEEVELLAEVAWRYSVPLAALGAGTASAPGSKGGGILIHFDLMRGLRLPEKEEPWVEAEPGASWLQLDDNLRTRGWGLAVYPTSAPRATVGGWLTQDGLGVGSFEYGWLSENVLSASLVMPGGGRALPAAGAHRAWGERFFPVAPSHPTPSSTRELVHLSDLGGALIRAEGGSSHTAVQGTVARSGEVLLLGIDPREGDRAQ